MLKKILLLIFICLFAAVVVCAEQTYTIKAGVSMSDRVPKEFYGSWRVTSNLVSTNNNEIFKKNTVDLWNLSKADNVITLENPFTGARASIVVNQVEGKVIKFQKQGYYDDKKMTDVVQLQLRGDTFSGENHLILNTVNAEGSITKSDKATYKLSGEKISGASIK